MTASRRWPLHVALGLPPLIFFAPVLFFGQALYHRDVGQYFYPHKAMIARALQHGHLAQWNPFEFGGMPLLVDPNFNAFHPLALLTDLAPMPWGFAAFVALNAWLTAWGTWWLAGELGLVGGARVVAALCYAWSGPYVSLVESGQSIALSTLPWQIAAFVALGRRPSTRTFAISAAMSALMLFSGTPEIGVCGFAIGPLLALSIAPKLRTVVLSGLSSALGIALSAIQILPTLAYMRGSSARGGGFNFGEATAYSLHPWRLLNLAIPFAFGELNTPGGPYWSLNPGLNDPYIQEIYLGLIPLFLAIAGLTFRSRPLRMFLLISGALVLVSFGAYTPLYKGLWTLLPPLHSIRFPQKFIVPVVLCLALFAGAGWGRLTPRRLTWAAALLGALSLGAWLWTPALLDPRRDRVLASTLLTSVAVECLLLGLALLALSRGRYALVGALLVVDLTLPAARMGVFLPAARLTPPPDVTDLLRKSADAPDGQWRVDTEHYASPADVDSFGASDWPRTRKLFELRQTALFGASGALDGISLAKGYSGFTTARMKAVYSSQQPREMMDLFGIRYGVSYGTEPGAPFEKLGFQPFAQLDGGLVRIWRNDHAGPKAWLTDAVLREQHAGVIPTCPNRPAAWTAGRGGASLLPGLSLVDRCEGLAPSRLGSAHVDVAKYDPETVVVRTNADGPGLLVLNDVWDPGWSVSVDGASANSLMADGAFRAAAVPAGHHEVTWRYQTPGLKMGALITLLALLMLLGLALWPRRSLADGALH